MKKEERGDGGMGGRDRKREKTYLSSSLSVHTLMRRRWGTMWYGDTIFPE